MGPAFACRLGVGVGIDDHKVVATVAGTKHAVACSPNGLGALSPEALAICKTISVE